MDQEQEARWVERLRARDEAAFDAIYDRYTGRLHGFLVRMTGRRDVAEELLQETWIRVVSEAGSLRDGQKLGPWLFAIARNLSLSHLRWRAVDAESQQTLRQAPPREAPSPFELTAGSELERRLEAALASLPPLYREVLLLVVEGLSPQEAAEALGVKPEAARQRLARARAMMEEHLAG